MAKLVEVLKSCFWTGGQTPHLHKHTFIICPIMSAEFNKPREQRVISGVRILVFGKKSTKYTDDIRKGQQTVVPFVGLDRNQAPSFPQVAVGVLFPDSRYLLGLGPRMMETELTGGRVMYAWRVMKLIEQMHTLEKGVVKFANIAMTPSDTDFNNDYHQHAAYHVSTNLERNFGEVKRELLTQILPQLDRMLDAMRRDNTTPHLREFLREVDAGRLCITPSLRWHIDETERKREKAMVREKHEELIESGARVAF